MKTQYLAHLLYEKFLAVCSSSRNSVKPEKAYPFPGGHLFEIKFLPKCVNQKESDFPFATRDLWVTSGDIYFP
jgi:hypothetical protein